MAAEADIERLAIDTIRTLSMDGVQRANSGHPGTPMALAPVACALWNEWLRFDPAHPRWPVRDRFVLSCGHASMLLYSILHLADVRAIDADGTPRPGPAVTLDDLKNFRQLGHPCAGHPEYGEVAGIETTTGPLGQGVATSVGMALASRWIAARYDREGFPSFAFRVYAMCGDGDLMEGVAYEAASLAGHLRLANLCWIYDDNKITIEGGTDLAFSEDAALRFEGLGWRVLRVSDANDLGALRRAFESFAPGGGSVPAGDGRPTLMIVRSTIGYGSPNKANSHAAHGAPLGADEVRLTKRAYGWPEDAEFLVPDAVRAHFSNGIGARGKAARDAWQSAFESYRAIHPEAAAELDRIWKGDLPPGWEAGLPLFPADAKGLATRISSGKVLNALASRIPWLIGGAADLAPSTMTRIDGESDFSAENRAGRNLHFGIREHAMGAAVNGMALCGLRPYGATFFVFTDYLRPALRLAALMRVGGLFVFTHDSIGLGEDGPTHQPVEHLAACRAVPGLVVLRPADANEVSESYRFAMSHPRQPVVLVLTRQNVPTLDRSRCGAAGGLARGAYVVRDLGGAAPDVMLIGTGSEVHLCLDAQSALADEGIRARVVSMPSFELFDRQDAAYRESVLPAAVTARIGVEAGVRLGWDRYLGAQGSFIGMATFGASAPFQSLYAHFGVTADRIVAAARELVRA
ncbi:MAG: transketolase [Planctomycetes bacterium]|nr:transketolase [Planctomycetota bacterium]